MPDTSALHRISLPYVRHVGIMLSLHHKRNFIRTDRQQLQISVPQEVSLYMPHYMLKYDPVWLETVGPFWRLKA